MEKTYHLVSDPLFLGLTRPTLIFGVSMYYALLNLMGSVVIFVQSSDFRIIFVTAIIHGVGYYLSFSEPKFMEIQMKYANKCNNCPNRTYYSANSYCS